MTPREVGYRRTSDLPWYWQAVHFVGAPLVDHWRGISLTRLIAAFCCVVVGHEVLAHEGSLSWVDFCVLVLAVGTAFGKMGYEAFLRRITLGVGSSSSTTTTRTEETHATNTEGQ